MFDLAIYYRMVGGFVGLGSTQLARLRWALAVAFYMTLLSLVHHEGILQPVLIFQVTFVGAFLGRLISHSRFQGTASIGNSLGMAVINVIRLLLIVGPYSFGHLIDLGGFHITRLFLALFGILAGVAYYIGWSYLNGKDSGIYFRNSPAQTTISNLDHAAITGSEWGELLTGWLAYELMFIVALVTP